MLSRSAPVLLLTLLFCLVGCQAATTSPSATAPATSLPADPDAPTVELLSPDATIPIPAGAPTEDDRSGAAVVSGTTLLEGANASGAGYAPNPKLLTIPAAPGEIVRVHLRATLEGGGMGNASVRIGIPGYTTTVTFPADNQWVYRSVYMPSVGSASIQLYNGATYEGPLNAPGLQVEYYLQNVLALTADEPNADNKPTTLNDFNLAANINLGAITNRTLFFYSPQALDIEEWYALKKTAGARDLDVTLNSLSDRYNTWVWRISFHRQGTGELIGLPYVLRPPIGTRTFRLHRLPAADSHVLMRISVTPTPVPTDTNVIHGVYSLYTAEPLQVLSASFRSGQNLADPGQAFTWATTHTGGDLPAAIWHWDFDGGATCTAGCTSGAPTTTFTTGGNYHARVWMEHAGESSATFEVPFTVRCRNDFTFTQLWPDLLTWPNGNDGALITAPGGAPQCIYKSTSGELKFRTPAALHHISNEIFPAIIYNNERRLSTLVHADRIWVAYQTSTGMAMFVSNDLTPEATSDWTSYKLDALSTSGLVAGFAAHQGQIALAYRRGSSVYDADEIVFARATVPVPLSGGGWELSYVRTSNTGTMPMALAGHAGYWWLCNFDSIIGTDHMLRSTSLSPGGIADWIAHDVPIDEGGSYFDALQFFEVDGRLAFSYSQRHYPIWDLQYAVAQVDVPQSRSDWQAYTYPTTGTLSNGYHRVQIIDGEYWLLYASSGSLRVLRSCDLHPEQSGSWSSAAFDGYYLGDPPYPLFYGFTEPVNDQMYLYYVDRYNYYYPTHNFNSLRRIPLSTWP